MPGCANRCAQVFLHNLPGYDDHDFRVTSADSKITIPFRVLPLLSHAQYTPQFLLVAKFSRKTASYFPAWKFATEWKLHGNLIFVHIPVLRPHFGLARNNYVEIICSNDATKLFFRAEVRKKWCTDFVQACPKKKRFSHREIASMKSIRKKFEVDEKWKS